VPAKLFHRMAVAVKSILEDTWKTSVLTILSTAGFFCLVFFVLGGVELFLPGWPAWRRFLATLCFGFFLVGTIISMIYAIESLISAASQRSLRPKLAARVARYSSIGTWCVALAGGLSLLLLKA